MKAASSTLASYLATRPDQLIAPDCFLFTLKGGSQYRCTNADVPVTDENGNVYVANSIRVEGLKYSVKVGLDIDEQDVTLSAYSYETILGAGWLQAMVSGVLDGAYISRYRCFLPAWGQAAIGSVLLFYGLVSTIDKLGRTEAQIKVKTDLARLDDDYPRNIYQASCLHTLFDSGCTLVKSAFATAATCGTGSTTLNIVWSNSAAAQYFDQGTFTFTSGALNGYQGTTKFGYSGGIVPVIPLPSAPAAGDTFNVYPGCDHTFSSCKNKFANTASSGGGYNFRGFPCVPQPATGL